MLGIFVMCDLLRVRMGEGERQWRAESKSNGGAVSVRSEKDMDIEKMNEKGVLHVHGKRLN